MGDKTGAFADHLAAGGGLIHQRHNSWGRTRSPKNLTGANGTAVALLADTSTLVGITASTAGYLTENQMYLHILLTDLHDTDPSSAALTIYGYCHAFQRWFELQQSTANGYGRNAGAQTVASSITVVDSGAAAASQVPSDREYRVYKIFGIDRVAFVHEDDTEVAVFAACNTLTVSGRY